MAPNVRSVRQNLDLVVDGGHPVPGLNANDTTRWGFTLGNQVYVWRSGVGVTADGALVYVGGPDLNITDLADVLARAGAVRAMELDINTDWVNFATYAPATPTGVASSNNGTRTSVEHVGRGGAVLRAVVVPGLHHHVGSHPLKPAFGGPAREPTALLQAPVRVIQEPDGISTGIFMLRSCSSAHHEYRRW